MVYAQPLQNLEGNLFLLNAISARWFPTYGPQHILQRLFPGLSRDPRTGPQFSSVGKAHTCRSLWFTGVYYLASMPCGHSKALPKGTTASWQKPNLVRDYRSGASPETFSASTLLCKEGERHGHQSEGGQSLDMNIHVNLLEHSSLRIPEPRKAGKVTQVCPEMALDIRRVAKAIFQIPMPLPACVGFSVLYLESISSMSLKPWWHPGRQCVVLQRWHLQVQRAC